MHMLRLLIINVLHVTKNRSLITHTNDNPKRSTQHKTRQIKLRTTKTQPFRS